jgi:hypothetical protein
MADIFLFSFQHRDAQKKTKVSITYNKNIIILFVVSNVLLSLQRRAVWVGVW